MVTSISIQLWKTILLQGTSQGSFDLTNIQPTTAVSAAVNNNQDDVRVEEPAEKIAQDQLERKLAESEADIGKNSTSGGQELGASRIQRMRSFIGENKLVRSLKIKRVNNDGFAELQHDE